jgi:hypothetical protein
MQDESWVALVGHKRRKRRFHPRRFDAGERHCGL